MAAVIVVGVDYGERLVYMAAAKSDGLGGAKRLYSALPGVFRRRVDKNLSTSKVFFLSASARYL